MRTWRGFIVAGALAVAAGVIGCTPKTGKSAPPSLTAVIDGEIVAADAISWSAERPLTWKDFRGTPPVEPGDEGARTAYSLFYGARCTGRRFEFRVLAAVLPRLSWVTPAVLKNPALSARSLRHEQTHFNLSEVHARRMRKYFADLQQPCANSEAELNGLAQRLVRAEATAQASYDQETNYGRTPAKQSEWEAETARQIESLAAYGDPVKSADRANSADRTQSADQLKTMKMMKLVK